MVTILPPKFNIGTQIGNALGGGLQQGLGQAFQQQYQAGKLADVFKNLQGVTDPVQIAKALAMASIFAPGADRALASIAPLLQQQNTTSATNRAIESALGNTASTIANQPSQASNQQQNISSPNITGTATPGIGSSAQGKVEEDLSPVTLGKYIPLDIGKIITPDQQRTIINEVGKAKGDINLARSLINDYNEGLITYNELLNSNVNRAWQQREKELQLENVYGNKLAEKLGENTPPSYQSIAYNMLKPFIKKGEDFNTAWLKTEPRFRNFEREMQAFEASIPPLSPSESALGIEPEKQKLWLDNANAIRKKYEGSYPVLQDFFTNKGYNILSVANALNPLPQDLSNKLLKSKDYRSELYSPSGFDGNAEQRIENISHKQELAIPLITSEIAQSWTPETSILNIFTLLREQGWLPQNAFNLIKNLREKVQFSPQQDVEANQVLKNPSVPLFEKKKFRK